MAWPPPTTRPTIAPPSLSARCFTGESLSFARFPRRVSPPLRATRGTAHPRPAPDRAKRLSDAPCPCNPGTAFRPPGTAFPAPGAASRRPAPLFRHPAPLSDTPHDFFRHPTPLFRHPAPLFRHPARSPGLSKSGVGGSKAESPPRQRGSGLLWPIKCAKMGAFFHLVGLLAANLPSFAFHHHLQKPLRRRRRQLRPSGSRCVPPEAVASPPEAVESPPEAVASASEAVASLQKQLRPARSSRFWPESVVFGGNRPILGQKWRISAHI